MTDDEFFALVECAGIPMDTEKVEFALIVKGLIHDMEWQLIEAAPKNRKVLIGYANSLGNWRTVVARYYPPETLELGDDQYELSEDGFAPEGWYEECESQENIYPVGGEPTHWMPLPAPPSNHLGQPARIGNSITQGRAAGPTLTDADMQHPRGSHTGPDGNQTLPADLSSAAVGKEGPVLGVNDHAAHGTRMNKESGNA